MSRFLRPPFNPADLDRLGNEEKTRLLFDWLRHDGDREQWLAWLQGRLAWIHSRAHIQDDPAPPRHLPVPQGPVDVAVISDPADVARALSDTACFSNAPYAELGGASFMLAIDPGRGGQGVDWHDQQRKVAAEALKYPAAWLDTAAQRAVTQAETLSLCAPDFDLAEWAGQAALRYVGLLFGFAGPDHLLLEGAARAGYRALQYQIVGRHFTTEPGTVPAAQQALARLAARCSDLMDEYARLRRAPRAPLRPATTHPAATWPDGVQPWHELGLSALGHPVLARLPALADRLNGQDLCALVVGLLVGTVGNVQTAVCQMVQSLLKHPAELARVKELKGARLQAQLGHLLAQAPPVPFLPRRTLKDVDVKGGRVPAGTDCIVVLRPSGATGCPHAWGGAAAGAAPAAHACVGRELVEPLLAALLRRTLNLPGLANRLDGLTGDVLAPDRLWGTGITRYPLRHDRDKLRVQQPLIVMMRVKSPIAEHAERLRQVVRCGAPRIQWALDSSRHVHVAWFEFMDNDSVLALRTVFDGDLDAYMEHFALKVGDLFDQLFESIEGAPPRPVAEHPNEFIDAIRSSNRSPAGGYFYCAYPRTETAQITALVPGVEA